MNQAATALARQIIDSNAYLTLATADRDGRPWASPVWYAPVGYREFLWVSRPDTRHSRNISTRPQVGLVIFDSTVAPGEGQAVYADAIAEELTGPESERAIAIYARRSRSAGAPDWRPKQVSPGAPVRLYRARAEALFVIDGDDRRISVSPGEPARAGRSRLKGE